MEIADRKICSFCTVEIPADSTLCTYCGKAVPKGQYEIVPDRGKLGVSIRGKIVIHGLELETAKEIVSILNSLEWDDHMEGKSSR